MAKKKTTTKVVAKVTPKVKNTPKAVKLTDNECKIEALTVANDDYKEKTNELAGIVTDLRSEIDFLENRGFFARLFNNQF